MQNSMVGYPYKGHLLKKSYDQLCNLKNEVKPHSGKNYIMNIYSTYVTYETKLTGSCLMSVKSTSHIFLRQVSQSQH